MLEKLLLAAIVTLALYINVKIDGSGSTSIQFQVQGSRAEVLQLLLSQNMKVRSSQLNSEVSSK